VERSGCRQLPPRETATQNVPVLERAVQALSGRRVNVYCWSSEDWKREGRSWDSARFGPLTAWRAYTSPETLTVELGPNICTELERLGGRGRMIWTYRDREAAAWSLQGVAHESVHVSGIRNESKAECYGMQRMPAAAVRLGLTTAEGRFLARLYWRDWYPRDRGAYHSPECRNGGSLDLHRGSSRWP
jgi:hypothetical protein